MCLNVLWERDTHIFLLQGHFHAQAWKYLGMKKHPKAAAAVRTKYHCTLSIFFGHFQLVLSPLCIYRENSGAYLTGCSLRFGQFPGEGIKRAVVTRILGTGTLRSWNEWKRIWWASPSKILFFKASLPISRKKCLLLGHLGAVSSRRCSIGVKNL